MFLGFCVPSYSGHPIPAKTFVAAAISAVSKYQAQLKDLRPAAK